MFAVLKHLVWWPGTCRSRLSVHVRAHHGFADVHMSRSAICGRVHMHTRDLGTCKCFHVVATCLPRGNICMSTNRVYVCERPQIAYVHVMTAVTYRATVMWCVCVLC